MHGRNMTPWVFKVGGMSGLDFRGKSEGPVYFETVGANHLVLNQYGFMLTTPEACHNVTHEL